MLTQKNNDKIFMKNSQIVELSNRVNKESTVLRKNPNMS